jgi:hypothetical protein
MPLIWDRSARTMFRGNRDKLKMSYFWVLLPPWIGWLIGALTWAAFGWISRGSLASGFFFALAGVYCIVAAVTAVRRKAAVRRRAKN